jgi:hypothetical protein
MKKICWTTLYSVGRSASLLTTLPILVKELYYTLIRLRDSFRLERLPHLGDAHVDMDGIAPSRLIFIFRLPSRAISLFSICFSAIPDGSAGERDGKDTHIIFSAKFNVKRPKKRTVKLAWIFISKNSRGQIW